jgi:flagellar biosynthesis protein FlhB
MFLRQSRDRHAVPQSVELNGDVSMVFSVLLYHKIGAFIRKTNMPVCERRVSQLSAWSESTKSCISALLQCGAGALVGIFSTASW